MPQSVPNTPCPAWRLGTSCIRARVCEHHISPMLGVWSMLVCLSSECIYVYILLLLKRAVSVRTPRSNPRVPLLIQLIVASVRCARAPCPKSGQSIKIPDQLYQTGSGGISLDTMSCWERKKERDNPARATPDKKRTRSRPDLTRSVKEIFKLLLILKAPYTPIIYHTPLCSRYG